MLDEEKKAILSWIATANNPTLQFNENSDYVEDGLRHCSKCRTAKQMYLNIADQIVVVGIPCRCRHEENRINDQIIQDKQEQERRNHIKEKGLRTYELMNATFDNDKNKDSKASEALRRYINNWENVKAENIGVLLYGSVGTGKTYYAGAIANAVIDKGDRALVMNVADITALREPEEQRKIEHRIDTWELFVLDDLGAERLTEYAIEKIYDAVDRRYSAGLPMIVTTNLSVEEMQNVPDSEGARKRIFDRVLTACSLPIRMVGKSKRADVLSKRQEIARQILTGEYESND